MANIAGRSYLSGSSVPRTGLWEAVVDASVTTGVPGVATSGTQDITSGPVQSRDEGAGANMTLANGWYFFRFTPDAFGGTPNDGPTPWMRYQVTGNTTWKAVVDAQPVGPPPPPDLAAQVAADRAATAAARDAAIAAKNAAEAVPTTNDGITASLLANRTSGSGTELDKQIGLQAPAKWSPGLPNIGIRSDAFFLRASSDGNVESQVAAFLADTNLAGKRRLVGYTKTANPVAVPANTWLDASQAVVEQTTTGKTTFNVTGDNVRLIGARMIGPNASSTYRDAENAVRIVGASAASPRRNVVIEDLQLERFGNYGIYAEHVYGLRINGPQMSAVGYAGIMMLSVVGFDVDGGTIDGIVGNGVADGYGVAMTRAEVNSLTTAPRTQDGSVHGMVIRNCPWEGIDSHAGKGIDVSGNRVTGCLVGIAMVPGDGDVNDSPIYAPFDFTISNNRIDSLVTDGTKRSGIIVAGAQGASATVAAVEYAEGIVTGNTVRGHGIQNSDISGGIYLRNTRGLVVSNNSLYQPGPFGITVYYDNRAASIMGNTVADAWSSTVTVAGAIATRGANNTGRAMGNTLYSTGAKNGVTYVNQRGFYASSATGVDFGTAANMAADNFFSAAATPVAGI